MKETFPIYDSEGDFVNFLLIKSDELVSYVNQNHKLDTLIKDVFKKEYKKVLNEEHTNYRRRMQGNTCLFSRSEYDTMADPETIFSVLIEKLNKSVSKLKLVGFPEDKYLDLVKNYKEYDMHKWYTTMNNL
jgi:fibrillarin-like rRNA methylase